MVTTQIDRSTRARNHGIERLRVALAHHRRVRRRVQRTGHALELAVDRCAASRTIPRGVGPRDLDRRPGVDEGVWQEHVRFRRTGDPRTLARLAAEYDRYARSLAARLHRDHESMEDLEQVAREALLRALRRFDPERSLPFPALATPTIVGALRRHYRDRGWAVRVPRRVHELTVAARATEDRITAQLGRTPSVAEVADEMGISIDELLEVHDAVHVRSSTSLDDLDDPAEGGGPSARDPLLHRVDDHLDLRAALANLDERDQTVVRLYFFEECSQSEIAARFGVSQMQVSRWLASILKRMRVWVRD